MKSDSKNSSTEVLLEKEGIDASETPATDTPTGYAAASKRITDWTSNFLASAVVVMIALVAGSHLASTYGPLTDESDDSPVTADLVDAWPALESCALQFGDSSIELQRDSLFGNREEVVGFLQSKCREILEQNSGPTGEFGEKQSSLVAELIDSPSVEPVEQEPGEWRIFHIEKPDVNSPLPLVIGIRETAQASKTGGPPRLAVWGIALPASTTNHTTDTTDGTNKTPTPSDSDASSRDGKWTSFIGRTVADDQLNRLKNSLLPDGAQRTLAIAGPNGGSLIGFSGGKPDQTKQFFDHLASEKSWVTTQSWQESAGSWSARYELPQDSPARGIQVQLHVNHNQRSPAPAMRGMLIVDSR